MIVGLHNSVERNYFLHYQIPGISIGHNSCFKSHWIMKSNIYQVTQKYIMQRNKKQKKNMELLFENNKQRCNELKNSTE